MFNTVRYVKIMLLLTLVISQFQKWIKFVPFNGGFFFTLSKIYKIVLKKSDNIKKIMCEDPTVLLGESKQNGLKVMYYELY